MPREGQSGARTSEAKVAEPHERPPAIQSIDRASRLLALFSAEKPEMSLSELASSLGLVKATTHRYAMSLRAVGLLTYNHECALYSVGPRVVELAAVAQAGLSYADVAEPFMTRLCASVAESVVLSAWDRTDPVVVRAHTTTARDASVMIRVGTRMPKYTAHYRVWLAFGGEQVDAERRRSGLGEELERIREAGIAIATRFGLRAFACPVFRGENLVAVMSIVGIAEVIPDGPDCYLAQELRATVAELSQELSMRL